MVWSMIQAAGWPIWPLLACSVVALALIIERFISLQTTHITPPKLLEQALMFSRQTLPSPQVLGQLEQNSLLGQVLASGFKAIHANPRCSEQDLRSSMEAAGRLVAQKLENNLTALATIASAAPLLGLLGTVVGIMSAFGSIGTDQLAVTKVSGGISEALIATAFGLGIAIFSLLPFQAMRRRSAQLRAEAEQWINRVELQQTRAQAETAIED